MGRMRMMNGNKKLHALTFSLPPIKSCLNHSSCFETCYANKAYRQYNATRALWDDNYKIAREEPYELLLDINAQLRLNSKYQYVRIHQSGDFFSQTYIDVWKMIAESNKNIIFYYYTKVSHMFNFKELNDLPNVVSIPSLLDGNRNYGSMEYISKLAEEHDAVICPATIQKDIRCGIECHKCMEKGAKVVFLQH